MLYFFQKNPITFPSPVQCIYLLVNTTPLKIDNTILGSNRWDKGRRAREKIKVGWMLCSVLNQCLLN
jgi:hypothetical protein